MVKDMKAVQSSEDGILTKIFRKILMETGFINSIPYFINRYTGKKNKASISRLVIDGEMTWNSFTFFLLEILKAKKVVIHLNLILKEKRNNLENVKCDIELKQAGYEEKTSGKILKDCFNNLCKKLQMTEEEAKNEITNYFKKGGKKNKATISKILTSDIISWKSFIFVLFELLKSEKVEVEIEFTSVANTKTTHELEITKN